MNIYIYIPLYISIQILNIYGHLKYKPEMILYKVNSLLFVKSFDSVLIN